MWRAFRLAILFVVLAGLSFTVWLSWLHRPFEKEDWAAAVIELDKAGRCGRSSNLITAVDTEGDPNAILQSLRRFPENHGKKNCVVRPARWDDRQVRSFAMTQDWYDFRVQQIEDDLNGQPVQAFRARWHLQTGWRTTVQFATDHWTRPDLAGWRTLAWIKCSNTELFDKPINQAAINRLVHFTYQGTRRPPDSRLERRRKWCGATLSYLSRETESDRPYPDRWLGRDARHFGNFDIDVDAIREGNQDLHTALYGEPWPNSWLQDLHSLASWELFGPAQVLLAELLLEGFTIEGIKAKNASLSALWATVAIEQGEDAHDLLARALLDLSDEDRARNSDYVDCWYTVAGPGMPVFADFVGIGHGLPIELARDPLDGGLCGKGGVKSSYYQGMQLLPATSVNSASQ